MNEEINKIINWIEMSYTRLNYKEELLLVNYIKQLQQENARLKEELKYTVPMVEHNKIVSEKLKENARLEDKIEKATKFVDEYMDEWDFHDEVWKDLNNLLILLKEN